ncbi:T9SS type A sorting domain-containing protein [Niastella populi]|uniref:Secretion system C-terminal sorting domain-containing protein n=1 Tax=Niastella populi TaxID=550983 RepID=A0A1V9FJG8_9BACT|nr:T9SS type A sorting domain-containing protein [Niastella populi]OQP58437.1 hypothetical protein A4R26_02985 [Niastella populi]
MKPNIYTWLAITAIALPLTTTAQAQLNKAHHPAQPQTIIKNNKQLAADISADWYNRALTSIQQLSEQIKPLHSYGSFSATNMRSRAGFYISPSGYKVQCMQEKEWQVAFRLKGIGRSAIQWQPEGQYAISHTANQLQYRYDNIYIEYINNSDGLRQNFLVNRKMPGDGALKVTIEPATELQPRLLNSNSLAFFNSENKMLLAYEDLHVWDATHKALPAAMRYLNGLLTIEVDDSEATYPVTIDPLNKTPEWTTSADGLISGLTTAQLHASLYGYAVTGLGDVNGDGYGDAAISAPALTDIFSGTGSLASVGAVFVFYGSPAGLSTIPAKTLQPNTAVAGALFGTSVDAGDVTGDGINDIIVGAPLDSYTTTAAGIIPTNVTVKAGKVYVFPGGNTAAANPTNFIEIKLQGTGFFSTGIANILLSNVSVNALFGFSVAAAGDLNGDNKSDIVVGAPGFMGVGLSAIQNGAAFVYYSNNLTTTAPVQLETPTLSLLGLSLPILHNGLLFGFSVDGAGDYNNDGYLDVVAGAPAGVDLSSLSGIVNGQILSGTAHVYYGTGSGVNSNAGTTLKPTSGSLLGNAANLFGYKVKGLKAVNGIRNGSIAIGAPAGGLLPNTLTLTIQSGNVHIFKKKSSPGSSATSDQVLESPRSTSLLSILNTLDLNVLFGAAIDNAYDVNCDGYADLVVGEPLSSGATLLQLQANAVGGSAYVFLGNSNGTFHITPPYTASATYGSEFLSVNAVSLFGYSVAGVPYVRGIGSSPRILIGSPAAALDFDNSLLNLGSTLGILFDFVAVDNGLGKGYLFNTQLCIGETPLPVTLTEFKGQEKNTVINLTWRTSEEVNLNRFEVERSRDGVHFETIGIVFPRENASHGDYAFNDKNAATGNNYYRLKMIDNDAAFKFSNVLTFTSGPTTGMQMVVAPNPATDLINIQLTGLSESSYRLELRSVTGQKFIERSFNVTGFRHTEKLLRTASMTPGIYFLTIFGKTNQKIFSNRVIVL